MKLVGMWQGKQLLFLCVLVFVTFVLLYNRLEYQILHLKESQDNLALSIAKLKVPIYEGQKVGSFPLDSLENEKDLNEASENFLIIYNRVPKTGSTSFVGVAYDLCSRNQFNVLHINVTKNSHVLSLSDQARFVYNVSSWVSKKPALYHGHMAYLDFSKFGVSQNPIFINIIRKPLDRMISYYYFLRNGDNFRPYVVRRRQGDKMSFDECVERQEKDCDPDSMWLQIPFFCGHAADCWTPGNDWALEEAKRNLVQRYFLVGVTEELDSFVSLLESSLPRIFKGATKQFIEGKKSHLRKTYHKLDPSESTISKIQASKVWQMENDFYEFALRNFRFIKKRTLVYKDGEMVDKGQQFMFEKIRPKLPVNHETESNAKR